MLESASCRRHKVVHAAISECPTTTIVPFVTGKPPLQRLAYLGEREAHAESYKATEVLQWLPSM